MQAKKSLGQHFLKSEKALRQIVAAGEISAHDVVLEIGPGTGILTLKLLEVAKQVIAVEKDRDLIEHLSETFAAEIASKKLILINQDILEFDPATLNFYGTSYKLIANIPYYITGAIIQAFLSTPYQPERMILLMQREVAERIVARNKKGSILSTAVHAYGKPVIIDRVPRGAFVPPPTVESAILAITHINRVFFSDVSNPVDETRFFSVMKSIFGRKRKQIGGSLAEYLEDKAAAQSILATVHIDPKTRPEDLALAQWKTLTQTLTDHGAKK